ncbi:glucosaminidase domain-containing protein [Shewanella sp. 5_MG-2023]|uniref:glucosaminidase domain-containing protein n=1 Tax=Shewanella sp. 5_MG-2023 TaxID=3062656 RepID=UPI0026E2BA96|nr:glucosaminidase domain-containing protein [Shewanella sp. 5_MG-2023]MDO6639303.1 glucosaminidase domain-containing protein [Shewanella sp. 5_MG-2023]
MTQNTYQKILFVLLLLAGLFAINYWVKSSTTENETDTTGTNATKSPTATIEPNVNHQYIDAANNKLTTKKPQTKASTEIILNSLDQLIELFDSLNYNKQSWDAGVREVPRLTFDSVSENWQKTSNEIPVQVKKMVFFRLMAPLILLSNENIILERKWVKQAELTDNKLIDIATKYKVIPDKQTPLTQDLRKQLLKRVDIMPPSLVLAQAAEESGWATSRFTVEGNAFFGQWDFSGNGMAPKKQRTELGNYGLARFNTPQASVEGYMLNINTHAAYLKLRQMRQQLRYEKKPITGLKLVTTLDKYSERGQAYIDSIQQMIRYNKLDQVDAAYLSDGAPIHLISANNQASSTDD